MSEADDPAVNRGGWIKRRTRIKAKGGSRFPKQRQPEYTAWITTLSCTVANADCWQGIHPAHVNRTRASGAPDLGEVVPLCPFHHAEQEGRTARFNAKYGIDLSAIAIRLACEYQPDFFSTEDPCMPDPFKPFQKTLAERAADLQAEIQKLPDSEQQRRCKVMAEELARDLTVYPPPASWMSKREIDPL